MNISGKSFRQHIDFLSPLFFLVGSVWALRLVLDFAAAPPWLIRFCSVTVVLAIAVLLATVLIHMQSFGGYANVIFGSLLLTTFGQLLILFAVVFSALTGIENIYSTPEFSLGIEDPFHFLHICSHLVGIPLLGLMGAFMSCVLLWLLRVILPSDLGSRE